jgi:hypothetical protein
MGKFAGRDEGRREEQEKPAGGNRFHKETQCRLAAFVERVVLSLAGREGFYRGNSNKKT